MIQNGHRVRPDLVHVKPFNPIPKVHISTILQYMRVPLHDAIESYVLNLRLIAWRTASIVDASSDFHAYSAQ